VSNGHLHTYVENLIPSFDELEVPPFERFLRESIHSWRLVHMIRSKRFAIDIFKNHLSEVRLNDLVVLPEKSPKEVRAPEDTRDAILDPFFAACFW
jgi:hypothetical protein